MNYKHSLILMFLLSLLATIPANLNAAGSPIAQAIVVEASKAAAGEAVKQLSAGLQRSNGARVTVTPSGRRTMSLPINTQLTLSLQYETIATHNGCAESWYNPQWWIDTPSITTDWAATPPIFTIANKTYQVNTVSCIRSEDHDLNAVYGYGPLSAFNLSGTYAGKSCDVNDEPSFALSAAHWDVSTAKQVGNLLYDGTVVYAHAAASGLFELIPTPTKVVWP